MADSQTPPADEITETAVKDVADAIERAFLRDTRPPFDPEWTEEARAAIAAYRPHLTAERDARDAAWKAYAADLAQLINALGHDAWRGVDKGHDVLDDIYQATVVPPLPAVLAETPAPTAEEA